MGFLSGLQNHDDTLVPFLRDPRLTGVLEARLGGGTRISFASVIVNMPGNARGKWHADWPYNQKNAGHMRIPYPDAVFHITTLWMLSDFSAETRGTLLIPGSHRMSYNPTSGQVDAMASFPFEINGTGRAGSVLVMDSRVWHATAPNTSPDPRVAVALRFAPWWLSTDVLRPGSADRALMVDGPGASENLVPVMESERYEAIPDDLKPLYRGLANV